MSKADDILFGIFKREPDKEAESNAKLAEAKLILVQALANSDAWKNVFLVAMHEERDAVLALIERCTDATTLSREAGRLLAYERVIRWAGETSAALSSELAPPQS